MKESYLFIGDAVLYNDTQATIVKIRKKKSENSYINDLNGIIMSMITDKILITVQDIAGNMIEVKGTAIKKLP